MQLTTYLYFGGNCEEAFRFYEKTLGGQIVAMMTHEGTPAAEHVPAEFRNKILHARLVVGDAVLMGSDSPRGPVTPSGFSVSIQLDDPAQAERIFNAFAEGGSVTMPFGETFWAKAFGMVTDRFGTPWMINVEKPA